MISAQQYELIEEERAKNEAQSPQQAMGSQAQEARGMRHGQSGRGSLPATAKPQRPATRPGTRKGTAMDAMQIFGMLAGGS